MNILLIIFTLISACIALRADQLDVVADVVLFRGNGTDSQWELHYSFSDTTLRYVASPTGFVGEMLCSLTVRRDTQVIVTDVWIAAAESNTSAPSHSRYYSGLRRVSLAPGTYNVTFVAVDVNNDQKKSTASFTSIVEGLSSRAGMSDVMFVMPKSDNADVLQRETCRIRHVIRRANDIQQCA
jgi:hypothetical protein